MTSWPAVWPSSARAETSARARRGSVTCAPPPLRGCGAPSCRRCCAGSGVGGSAKGCTQESGQFSGREPQNHAAERAAGLPRCAYTLCCGATQRGVRRFGGGSAVGSGGITRQNEVAALPRARTPFWSARSERVYALWYMAAAVSRLTRVRARAQNAGKPGEPLARSIARVSVGPGVRTPFCSNLVPLVIA